VSDETTPTPKMTDTIVKKSVEVVIGEERYTISTFKFAKSLLALQYLSELAAAAGIEQAMMAADVSAANGEFAQEGGIASSFVTQIIRVIPKALRDGVPALYQLLGLVVTSNKDLKALEMDDGADTAKELYKKGRELAYDGDVNELMNLIAAGAAMLGVEGILKNLAPLMGMLKR
jgi:hypothetical protein